MKNHEILNINHNESEGNDINREVISIEGLQQGFHGPTSVQYDQLDKYVIYQQDVDNFCIKGNTNNRNNQNVGNQQSQFNQKQKSICNTICEFFKNLFCCGCGCIQTKD